MPTPTCPLGGVGWWSGRVIERLLGVVAVVLSWVGNYSARARVGRGMRMRRLPSTEIVRADFDTIARALPAAEQLDEHEQWACSLVPEGTRVLDVGCGVGRLARAMAGRARQVVGLDLSQGMLEVAAERSRAHSNVRFVNAELMTWAPNERFDCVVSIATLHHLELEPALLRIAALLRPRGRLIVVDLLWAWAPSELVPSARAYMARVRARAPAPVAATQSTELHALWKRHGRHDRLLSLRRVRRAFGRALPAATITRQRDWRYRAVWRKPA